MDEPLRSLTVAETLEELRTAIWHRRPILGEIMQKHGDKNLFQYTKDFLDVNSAPRLDMRKPELIAEIEELTAERLGPDVAKSVAGQLKRMPLVSTADHHAPLTHPFWVNANLITALPAMERPDLDLQHIVVLSFASVSLNNASGFPRGVQFYGGVGGSENILRVPLLPDKLKMGVVYKTRGFTTEDIARVKADLDRKQKEGRLSPERAAGVMEVIDRFFATDDIYACSDLSSQITRINYKLWPHLFHGAVDAESSEDVPLPSLLYIDIETLVTRLLLKKHLQDKTSLVYKFMFDLAYRAIVLRDFDGIPGAFSTKKGWGTHYFWGIDAHHHRVKLHLVNNELTNADGDLKIPFTPEGIAAALNEGKAYPAMLLCYLMVSLYYGMKCLGGFCQVNDLTMSKAAWQKLLREVGENEEADALEPVQTKELGGDGMVLAYVRTADEHLMPASSFDMILNKNDTSVRRYLDRSKHVSLTEMMNPLLPEMYTVLYSSDERKPEYLKKTLEEIVIGTGLQEKLLGIGK